MRALINVEIDRDRRRLTAYFSGLLTVADVTRFAEMESKAVAALGVRTGEYDILFVAEDHTVQTIAVTQAVQESIASSNLRARRIAVVSCGSLAGLQSKRLSKARNQAKTFARLVDAEAWLERSFAQD